MTSFPHTANNWRRLKTACRALLAHVFLGWALKADAREVLDTIESAQKLARHANINRSDAEVLADRMRQF